MYSFSVIESTVNYRMYFCIRLVPPSLLQLIEAILLPGCLDVILVLCPPCLHFTA